MDILSDLIYLAVAAVFFGLSFGLVIAFGRMMVNGSVKERKS